MPTNEKSSRLGECKNDSVQSVNHLSPNTLLRYQQVFQINNQTVTMKIDSGAKNSIISKLDWQKMGEPALTPTNNRISASGTKIQLEGVFDADVEFQGKHYTLPLQVSSKDDTRNLIGRRWFPIFSTFDWNALFYDGGKIIKLRNDESSEPVSDQTEDAMFSSIPYFVRVKVENKPLRMLLDTGATASVIGFSEWKKIGEPKLEQPKRRVIDTAGVEISLLGEGLVNVAFNGNKHVLPIAVKKSDKPCAILGTRYVIPTFQLKSVRRVISPSEMNTLKNRRLDQFVIRNLDSSRRTRMWYLDAQQTKRICLYAKKYRPNFTFPGTLREDFLRYDSGIAFAIREHFEDHTSKNLLGTSFKTKF